MAKRKASKAEISFLLDEDILEHIGTDDDNTSVKSKGSPTKGKHSKFEPLDIITFVNSAYAFSSAVNETIRGKKATYAGRILSKNPNKLYTDIYQSKQDTPFDKEKEIKVWERVAKQHNLHHIRTSFLNYICVRAKNPPLTVINGYLTVQLLFQCQQTALKTKQSLQINSAEELEIRRALKEYTKNFRSLRKVNSTALGDRKTRLITKLKEYNTSKNIPDIENAYKKFCNDIIKHDTLYQNEKPDNDDKKVLYDDELEAIMIFFKDKSKKDPDPTAKKKGPKSTPTGSNPDPTEKNPTPVDEEAFVRKLNDDFLKWIDENIESHKDAIKELFEGQKQLYTIWLIQNYDAAEKILEENKKAYPNDIRGEEKCDQDELETAKNGLVELDDEIIDLLTGTRNGNQVRGFIVALGVTTLERKNIDSFRLQDEKYYRDEEAAENHRKIEQAEYSAIREETREKSGYSLVIGATKLFDDAGTLESIARNQNLAIEFEKALNKQASNIFPHLSWSWGVLLDEGKVTTFFEKNKGRVKVINVRKEFLIGSAYTSMNDSNYHRFFLPEFLEQRNELIQKGYILEKNIQNIAIDDAGNEIKAEVKDADGNLKETKIVNGMRTIYGLDYEAEYTILAQESDKTYAHHFPSTKVITARDKKETYAIVVFDDKFAYKEELKPKKSKKDSELDGLIQCVFFNKEIVDELSSNETGKEILTVNDTKEMFSETHQEYLKELVREKKILVDNVEFQVHAKLDGSDDPVLTIKPNSITGIAEIKAQLNTEYIVHAVLTLADGNKVAYDNPMNVQNQDHSKFKLTKDDKYRAVMFSNEQDGQEVQPIGTVEVIVGTKDYVQHLNQESLVDNIFEKDGVRKQRIIDNQILTNVLVMLLEDEPDDDGYRSAKNNYQLERLNGNETPEQSGDYIFDNDKAIFVDDTGLARFSNVELAKELHIEAIWEKKNQKPEEVIREIGNAFTLTPKKILSRQLIATSEKAEQNSGKGVIKAIAINNKLYTNHRKELHKLFDSGSEQLVLGEEEEIIKEKLTLSLLDSAGEIQGTARTVDPNTGIAIFEDIDFSKELPVVMRKASEDTNAAYENKNASYIDKKNKVKYAILIIDNCYLLIKGPQSKKIPFNNEEKNPATHTFNSNLFTERNDILKFSVSRMPSNAKQDIKAYYQFEIVSDTEGFIDSRDKIQVMIPNNKSVFSNKDIEATFDKDTGSQKFNLKGVFPKGNYRIYCFVKKKRSDIDHNKIDLEEVKEEGGWYNYVSKYLNTFRDDAFWDYAYININCKKIPIEYSSDAQQAIKKEPTLLKDAGEQGTIAWADEEDRNIILDNLHILADLDKTLPTIDTTKGEGLSLVNNIKKAARIIAYTELKGAKKSTNKAKTYNKLMEGITENTISLATSSNAGKQLTKTYKGLYPDEAKEAVELKINNALIEDFKKIGNVKVQDFINTMLAIRQYFEPEGEN